MAKVLVIGDIHLDRSLPHSRMVDNKNDRYDFQKKLLVTAMKNHDNIILLGDVTHQKDFIDAKVMLDFADIIRRKKVVHVIGNHDWSGSENESSMGEVLSNLLPNYTVAKDVWWEKSGVFVFVFAPYYAKEEAIQSAIDQALLEGGRRVIVFGHFNFYNELMGGKKFPSSWFKSVTDRGVRFVLGHIHPPSTIAGVGEYLGVMNPLVFKESQGTMLEIDTESGAIARLEYPFGEEFAELDFEDRATWALGRTPNEHKYLKVYYDPKLDASEVRKEVLERIPGPRGLMVVPKAKDAKKREEKAREITHLSTSDDIIVEVAAERGFDPKKIMEAHQRVKEMV